MGKKKIKKVVIKIHDDGAIEIVSKDAGVAVLLQYPDGAEVQAFEGDKKIFESPKDE